MTGIAFEYDIVISDLVFVSELLEDGVLYNNSFFEIFFGFLEEFLKSSKALVDGLVFVAFDDEVHAFGSQFFISQFDLVESWFFLCILFF